MKMRTLIVFLLLKILRAIEVGQNLLANSNFSQPDITSSNSIYTYFQQSIPGWNCTNICELNNCEFANKVSILYNLYHGYFGECEEQAIDLSPNSIEAISQIFITEEGEHRFILSYLLPSFSANRKTLEIYLNGIKIYSYRPIFESDYLRYNANFSVYPQNGQNNITLTMSGLSDPYGFRIVNIQIRRYNDLWLNKTISKFLKNEYLAGLVSTPSSRVIFGQLLGFLSSLDRLQLYFYHDRNYSYSYKVLIDGVFELLSSKGQISQRLAYKALPSMVNQQENFLSIFDFKCQSIKSRQNSCFGFITNNHNFFIYSVPFITMQFFLLFLLFKILFKKKISKLIRNFSFYGIILLLITEGNIQQFSFQLIDELLNLIFLSPAQKIINTFVVLLFFLIIFCSVAVYLCFWYVYKKYIRYFAECVNINISGIVVLSLDKGLFCFLLGATHRIMITHPSEQLIALASVQFLWIMTQIYGLHKRLYKRVVLISLSITQGFIRILFLGTLLLYDDSIQDKLLRAFADRLIHLNIVYCFIFIWIINIFVSLIAVYKDLGQVIKRRHKPIKAPKIFLKPTIRKNINRIKAQRTVDKNSLPQRKNPLPQKTKTIQIKIMGKAMKLMILQS